MDGWAGGRLFHCVFTEEAVLLGSVSEPAKQREGEIRGSRKKRLLRNAATVILNVTSLTDKDRVTVGQISLQCRFTQAFSILLAFFASL